MRKILSFLSVLSLTPIVSTSVVACNNASSSSNVFDILANTDLDLEIKVDSNKNDLEEIIKSKIIFKVIQEFNSNNVDLIDLILIMKNFGPELTELLLNIYKLNPQTILEDDDLINEDKLDLKITLNALNKIISFKSVKLNISHEKSGSEIIKTINEFNQYNLFFNSLLFIADNAKKIYVGMEIEEFQNIFETEIRRFIEKILLSTFFNASAFQLEVIKNNDNDLTDEDLNHSGTLNLNFVYSLETEESLATGEIIKQTVHFPLV